MKLNQKFNLPQILLGHCLAIVAAGGLYIFITKILKQNGSGFIVFLPIFLGYCMEFRYTRRGKKGWKFESYVLRAGIWSLIITVILGLFIAFKG